MKTFILALELALLLALSAHAVWADDTDSGNNSDEHHHHRYPWAVSFSPRYYTLNTTGYSGAFTGAGVAAPSSGTVGIDFEAFWTLDSDWQLGFGIISVGTQNTTGSSTAQYNDEIFGLWVAKDFQLEGGFDIALGSLFGYSGASAQVITTGTSGQTSESAFAVEPKVIVSYKITHWFKLGVSGSYVEPLSPNQTIEGNTLTSGHISLHGASGGVEFEFGHFGGDEKRA